MDEKNIKNLDNEEELFDDSFNECDCDDDCGCEHIIEDASDEIDIEVEYIKLQEELLKQNDMLLRTAAEFDNYKKRIEKERESIGQFARINFIKGILPSIDNINLALTADNTSEDYIKGIELSLKSLVESLKTIGLEEYGTAGEKFDPNIHEAVMHIEDENYDESTIADVFKIGYKIGDQIVRPAMVKVAN